VELRRLRYFIAVAEELSFSRAAGKMYLSQPALSQQIRKLEEEIGVGLFRRDKRSVELTQAGETLLPGIQDALVQVDQSVRAAREISGIGHNQLRVGFPEYVNHTTAAGILRDFKERAPGVELGEHEVPTLQHTRQHITELVGGTLDAGFVLTPIGEGVLKREHIMTIGLVAALPADHPLAALQQVPMWELRKETLILFSSRLDPDSYDYVTSCCLEAGFDPYIIQRTDAQLYSRATTYRQVAAGTGIAIVVPPTDPLPEDSGVVFRPLVEPTPELELVVAWRRDNLSPNLAAFLHAVYDFVESD
jgi:DNA-binding transcriptional LysR family regulator